MGSIEMSCAGWILLAGFPFSFAYYFSVSLGMYIFNPLSDSSSGSYGFVCVGTEITASWI